MGFSQMVTESLHGPTFFPHTFNYIATSLFILECYHLVGHLAILCRLRMLPCRDLVGIRYYFLIDTLTVFTVSFVYTGQLKWLASIQIIQHMYFFLTWNKTSYTKKVMAWSSLDWLKSKEASKRWQLDVALGTGFDVAVHAINMYILVTFLSILEVSLGLIFVMAATMLILFSPKLAWSSPSSVPAWVERRIKPINIKAIDEASLLQ